MSDGNIIQLDVEFCSTLCKTFSHLQYIVLLAITYNMLRDIYVILYTTMTDFMTCRNGLSQESKWGLWKTATDGCTQSLNDLVGLINRNFKVCVFGHVCMKFMKGTRLVSLCSWQRKNWSCKALWWTVQSYTQETLSKWLVIGIWTVHLDRWSWLFALRNKDCVCEVSLCQGSSSLSKICSLAWLFTEWDFLI